MIINYNLYGSVKMKKIKLYSNEEKEETIDWTYGYDKLKSGKYRLVRCFTSEENLPYSSNVAEKIYIEFDIS